VTQLDLAIRGGTIVTASDEFRADIGIRDGRIVSIADRIEGAAREIDATGLLALPGGIDSHVHISQPSGPDVVMADDFASATRAAAAGGNTMVLPFALQEKGTSLRTCVENYRKLAEGECYIDTAFHLIISDPTAVVLGQELPALVKDGYTSFKVFMTYDDLVLSDSQLLEVFERRERRCAPASRTTASSPRASATSTPRSTSSSPTRPRSCSGRNCPRSSRTATPRSRCS